ncbi:polar amino acid ABC transporter permease [Burkholderia sp. SRS-W-2-2016]|uniref:amino acid ABC transporter permease n=1 Tax=Burkholderia sp. SRS-W-2-2016 TaxID=1926878 RepID=UPI00094B4054|nr:amino acid ABC transporter permease [Burkholderia sp. SRS-W-2-2016]OLL27651.1 polar amino acid ABC transporter permease [Burkholderia sp. SRS-W-2-2016]
MNFSWEIFRKFLMMPSSTYLHGLWLTCGISASAIVLGMVLGLVIALLRLSPSRPLQYFARCYIWVMRGTPLLVQIVFLYTAFAAADIFRFHDLDFGVFTLPGNIQAAVLALGMNSAAYMAEIIRAGLSAVDRGQYEASRSLGMTSVLLMRRVVLPQALRVIVPPMGNEFNVMLKNTTLVSVIGVPELMLSTQMVTSVNFRVFELYLVLAIYFLLLTTLWGFVQRRLEAHFGRGEAHASPGKRLFGGQTMKLLRGR